MRPAPRSPPAPVVIVGGSACPRSTISRMPALVLLLARRARYVSSSASNAAANIRGAPSATISSNTPRTSPRASPATTLKIGVIFLTGASAGVRSLAQRGRSGLRTGGRSTGSGHTFEHIRRWSMAHNTSVNASSRQPLRLLGVFAHPDDETLCAGGTFAKYASAGAEVRVISLTKGGAGQIRDASAATRATLTAVREKEFDAAGKQLGLSETRCLDYPDGGLSEIDSQILIRLAAEMLREIDPDVVITFGPDGFSGHPDHIAVGAAVTAACYEMRSATSSRLFHCHLPRSRMLLRDRLAEWVVELTTRFKGTKDFIRALSVFSREATALGYASDFVNLEWFPAGSYLIEQGEAATKMYFLLSGHVEIRREGEDGRVRVVDGSGPGEFIGEAGIATGQPRNAHVVAVEDVTSLTFSASEPVPFEGRGEQAQLLRTRSLPSGDQIDARVSTCIDVSDFVGHKIRATAAHRSQYPIDPRMFPDSILREMFGVEYFIQVLPERELHTSLLDE
jgi:LmbE family N-acetylglucosaminyl deacetylase